MPRLSSAPPEPAATAWNTVARYDSYSEAQAAVDRLSDDGFPVQDLDILGSDLRLVERVTGRLTKARAALAGAAAGAWLGLLAGLLLGLFTTGSTWITIVAASMAMGVAWGAVLGFAARAATRGRRDFASVRTITATRYDLVARGGSAERARVLLAQAGLPTTPAPS